MKGIKWPYNKDIISIAMAMKGVFTKGIERDGERGGGRQSERGSQTATKKYNK